MSARKVRAAAMRLLFSALDRGDRLAAIQLRAIARAADGSRGLAIVALAVVALMACAVEPAQPVAWDVGVRPVAAEGSDPMWASRVDAAATEWSTMLVAAGCPDPFDGSAGTAPVALVTDLSGHGSTIIGWTDHEEIEVLGTPDDLAHYPTYGHSVLMHEMGHALGLVHIAPATDADSIMHATSDRISDPDEVDVADVAARLGCS